MTPWLAAGLLLVSMVVFLAVALASAAATGDQVYELARTRVDTDGGTADLRAQHEEAG